MSFQELGSIGEFLGAIAVVVSLVYLAIQIRQNTRAVRVTTFQENRQQLANLTRLLARPEMATAYRAGLRGAGELSDEDRTPYLRWLLGHPGPTEWWERNQAMFSIGFRDYLEVLRGDSTTEGTGVERP